MKKNEHKDRPNEPVAHPVTGKKHIFISSQVNC